MNIFEKVQNRYISDEADDFSRPSTVPFRDQNGLLEKYEEAINDLCENIDLLSGTIQRNDLSPLSMYVLTATSIPSLHETTTFSENYLYDLDTFRARLKVSAAIKSIAVYIDTKSFTVRYIEPHIIDKRRILDVVYPSEILKDVGKREDIEVRMLDDKNGVVEVDNKELPFSIHHMDDDQKNYLHEILGVRLV